ncbi:hypothetical protein ACFQX7_22850 [Luedemannella flava]
MTRTVFDRRRAERFAQLIAEDGGAPRHHSRSDIDAELAPLVEITRRVTSIPVSAEPDPEFRVGLRAMLTARIEREGIGATAVEPRGPHRRWSPTNRASPRGRWPADGPGPRWPSSPA